MFRTCQRIHCQLRSISKELTDKKDLRNSIKRHFGNSLRIQDVSWLVDNIECKEIDEDFVYDSCTKCLLYHFPR